MTTPESKPLNYVLKPQDEQWGSVQVRRARIDGKRPRQIDPEIVARVTSSYKSHQAMLYPEKPQQISFGARVRQVIQRIGGGR